MPEFILEFCPYFRLYNARIFAKNSPVILQKEPVWRISHTALLLLLTFSCFFWHSIAHIAHLRHFCTLHSSQVMLWGLQRAMSGYLVSSFVSKIELLNKVWVMLPTGSEVELMNTSATQRDWSDDLPSFCSRWLIHLHFCVNEHFDFDMLQTSWAQDLTSSSFLWII